MASGLASTDLVVRLLKSGDHIVSMNDVYGGKLQILVQTICKFCWKMCVCVCVFFCVAFVISGYSYFSSPILKFKWVFITYEQWKLK